MKKIGSGKVRDIYEVNDQRLILVVSDRISAFDRILPTEIPQKGIILNQLSVFWFNYVLDIVPNHILSIKPEDFPAEFQNETFRGRTMLVKKLEIIPVECIVRGYLSGSAWKNYIECGETCRTPMPEGLKESEKLPHPLFTPSTKAHPGAHDENITFEQTIELLGFDLAEKLKSKSIEIYEKCAAYAFTKGIIIADTKFEFGLDEQGQLVLADEVLTPDSSRYWLLSKYKVGKSQDSLDKQYLRDWLLTNGYATKVPQTIPQTTIDIVKSRYLECYETLTGQILKY